MGGTVGLALLAAVWGIALAGAAAKLIAPAQLGRASYLLYLAQGWACVFTMQPLLADAVADGDDAAAGRRRRSIRWASCSTCRAAAYHNAIWHGFVLVASACHFGAVMNAVVLG